MLQMGRHRPGGRAAGIDVVMIDAQPRLADKGEGGAPPRSKAGRKGKLDAGDARARRRGHIRAGEGYDDLAECDFVVEAATEKQELEARRSSASSTRPPAPGAILASNTSSISITLLGAQTKRPSG